MSSKGASAQKQPEDSVLEKLGLGLITGAADDDPSGIATYSLLAYRCAQRFVSKVAGSHVSAKKEANCACQRND